MSRFENQALKIMAEEADLCEETQTEEQESDDKRVISMAEKIKENKEKSIDAAFKIAKFQTNENAERTLSNYLRFKKISNTYAQKAREERQKYHSQMQDLEKINELSTENRFELFK